jgi:hypothetical protein
MMARPPVGVVDADAVDAAGGVIRWHLDEPRRLLYDLHSLVHLAATIRLDNWLGVEARRTSSHRIATNRAYRCGSSAVSDAKDIKTSLATLAERRRARMVEDGRRRSVSTLTRL